MSKRTICYIEETCQPSDFFECFNCRVGKHTCNLTQKQFEQNIENKYCTQFSFDCINTLKKMCTCKKCLKMEYCENFKIIAYEKMSELAKINCKVCRADSGIDPPLDTTCKCLNKKELYFYKISLYKELDVNKNECYIIEIYKYDDFLKEKNEFGCACDAINFIYASSALEKNHTPVCSFSIYDTLDESDSILKELLEKHKTMFNRKVSVIDDFYFRKLQNVYNKIINKSCNAFDPKPNAHYSRKKKIK